MFKTKGQEVKTGGGTQKSFQPGVVYAHIYDATVRTNKNGDKKTLELILEGPAMDGFEGWSIAKNDPDGPKFKGQSARVSATIWTDKYNSDQISENDILNKLLVISEQLGLRAEVDKVAETNTINTIEDWVKLVVKLLKGKNLYFFLKGTEEEYNGKTLVKLSLPRYNFCSQDESKLEKFDKANPYHYKALLKTAVSSFEPINDDFDM